MRLPLLATVLLFAAPSAPSFDLPPALSRLLDGGAWDSSPPGLRIIALSQIADACAQQGRQPARRAAATACLSKVERAARRLQAPERAADGLFLTHYALILGAQDVVEGCVDPALHARLARRLEAMSLADPHAHAPSYTSTSLRWPADQSATLAALQRFDQAHAGTTAERPLAAWKRIMAQSLDASGLPRSEVTTKGAAAGPRGCAQSYLSRYLAEVDPVQAHAWWTVYREQFLVRPGPFVGFREWPPGVERPADVDSGPILFGIGAAASAFGISAAKAQGDVLLAAQLEGSADLVLASGAGGGAAHSLLAEAIRLQARWQPALVADAGT